MIARNFVITSIILLAGLATGYFAFRKAPDTTKTDASALGASSIILSNKYLATEDHRTEVMDQGFITLKNAIARKDMLLQSRDTAISSLESYDRLLVTADYDIEYFRLMDYYTQFYMNYYHWIQTGDPGANTSYQLALGQFKAVMAYHEQKYEKEIVRKGLELDEARQLVVLTEKTPLSVRWGKVVVVLSLFLLLLGIPGAVRDRANRKFAGTLYFDAVFRPAWISTLNLYHGTWRVGLFLMAIYLLDLVVFSSFSSTLVPLCLGGLGLIFALVLALLINRGRDLSKILVTLLGPKVLFLSLILVFVAIRGPQYFWYQVWTSDLFRMIFLSLFFMLLFRKFQIYVTLSKRWSQGTLFSAVIKVSIAMGVQLLLVGLALIYFGLEGIFAALNNDLLLFPFGLLF